MSRPIAVDLFAGAGGMSLGFEQAGYDVVAAVEVDPIHAAVHHYNFPYCAMLARSVMSLSGAAIRLAAGINDQPVDVVFGGPPCQGFSLIGQRILDDPRNGLVREFVRIVAELDAAYFVFENVKGLTVGRHRRFLAELIETFEAIGYRIRMPWQVLNACCFDVPQDRERLILLGAKENLPLPRYPVPVTSPVGQASTDLFGDLKPCPSCADALGDLPEAEEFSALLHSDTVATDAWGTPSAYARKMRCLDNDAWGFGYRRYWNPQQLTASLRSAHTDISRRRFAETSPGSVEPISRFFRLPVEGISNTLRAGTDAARGAFTSPRPIHYAKARCITVREMARLHGFPDWFRFHETKWHGARQVGNAVPPPLARAVAEDVLAAGGHRPLAPETPLDLGDPALLSLDMTEASRFWGVPNPIGRRDRKSGTKKRRQVDIEALRLAADAKSGG